MEIHRSVFYRAQHVTEPTCVLVSIRFGKTPVGGPKVVRLLPIGKDEATVSFDLNNHIAEIISGVQKANQELGGDLEVEVIEVVPDDYPRKSQVEYVAYKIASAVLRNEI